LVDGQSMISDGVDASSVLGDSDNEFADIDETEMAYQAAGAVTTDHTRGNGAVVRRKFKRAKPGHKHKTRFREVTRILCVERMISPSTGQGPASVQKFVVCVGVDNKVYIFQDTSEDAVRGGAESCWWGVRFCGVADARRRVPEPLGFERASVLPAIR